MVPVTSGGTQVTWNDPTSTFLDNSGIIATQSQTHYSGDFFRIGATTVTYTATDPSGNVGMCTFEIAIVTGKTQ